MRELTRAMLVPRDDGIDDDDAEWSVRRDPFLVRPMEYHIVRMR
jgi:hypothetical protein